MLVLAQLLEPLTAQPVDQRGVLRARQELPDGSRVIRIQIEFQLIVSDVWLKQGAAEFRREALQLRCVAVAEGIAGGNEIVVARCGKCACSGKRQPCQQQEFHQDPARYRFCTAYHSRPFAITATVSVALGA